MTKVLQHTLKKDSKAFKTFFKSLYEELYTDVYRFALVKVRNSDLANDFTQEAFGKLWLNKENVDFSQNIKSYLFKSIQNISIDYFRKKSTQSEQHTDFSAFDFSQSEESSEVVQNVLEAISKCPKNHQEAFILNKVEGYKYQEISDIFNVSPKTIESWMSNVLKHLREFYKT